MQIFPNRLSGLALRSGWFKPRGGFGVLRLVAFFQMLQGASRLAKRTSSLANSLIRSATLPSEIAPLRKADPTA